MIEIFFHLMKQSQIYILYYFCAILALKKIANIDYFCQLTILGFFSFSYLSNLFVESNRFKDYKKTAIMSLVFSVVYASSDEFHQTFVAGRDGNIIDVLIDSSGALVGIIISSIIYFLIVKK